jgi:hypothetical protein
MRSKFACPPFYFPCLASKNSLLTIPGNLPKNLNIMGAYGSLLRVMKLEIEEIP